MPDLRQTGDVVPGPLGRDAAAEFGLGCVNLGHPSRGGVSGGVRLVHMAMDFGVRFYGTADAYGGGVSERVLGRALRKRRAQAFVATKAGYLFRDRGRLERVARHLAMFGTAQGRPRPSEAPGPGRAEPRAARRPS